MPILGLQTQNPPRQVEYRYNVQGVLGASIIVVATGLTRYISPCGDQTGGSATERGLIIPIAGTLKNHYVRIITNTLVADSTLTLRVDKADSTMEISIPAGTTGTLSDITTEVDITADQEVDWELVTGAGGGSISLESISCVFLSETSSANATKTRSSLSTCNSDGDTIGSGLLRYVPPFIVGAFNLASATETSFIIPVAGTLKRLLASVSVNTLTDVCVVTVRKNGADTSGPMTITVPAGADYTLYPDNTNTETVDAGDIVSFEIDTTAAGAGSITFDSINVELED